MLATTPRAAAALAGRLHAKRVQHASAARPSAFTQRAEFARVSCCMLLQLVALSALTLLTCYAACLCSGGCVPEQLPRSRAEV